MRQLATIMILLVSSLPALAMDSVPKPEYRQRRSALAEKLNGGIAILFAADEPLLDFMPYRQDSDFFYLTGWNEPGAALIVIGAGPASTVARTGEPVPAHPYREILLLPERDRIMEKYTGVKMDAAAPAVQTATGVDEVLQMSALPRVITEFLGQDRRLRSQHIWRQLDVPAAASTLNFVAASFGLAELPPAQDVRALTMALRIVKSPAEIALLKQASNASIAGQLAGMHAIKPGVRERTVAGIELETMMASGCERPSYAAIVGSGPNSTVLHYAANDRIMQKGDLVVIDEAGEYSMYASDITRTMPVSGRFTPRQKEIYDIVLGAQRAAAQAFVSGQSRMGSLADRTDAAVTDSLDKVAYDYINTHGKDLHGEPLGKYFLHGIGHSVGIDVHDPMDYAHTRLNKGMVFTIEPGIYIPEENLGIRVEDVFYVDANGRLVDFIQDLAHDTAAVEAVMRSESAAHGMPRQ